MIYTIKNFENSEKIVSKDTIVYKDFRSVVKYFNKNINLDIAIYLIDADWKDICPKSEDIGFLKKSAKIIKRLNW